MATGFVLPLEAAPSGEPQSFGIVPGEWTPGEPIHPAALGLTVEEMRALIERHGLPLEETTVGEFDAEAELAETAGIPSGAASRSEATFGLPRSPSRYPGLTAEEADERDRYDAEMRRNPPPAAATMMPPEAGAEEQAVGEAVVAVQPPSPRGVSTSPAAAMNAKDAVEAMGSFSDAELVALASDPRKTVREGAEAEAARRADAAAAGAGAAGGGS